MKGRSWAGWHHHTTLVMMAHAFLTLEHASAEKKLLAWTLPRTRREMQICSSLGPAFCVFLWEQDWALSCSLIT